MHRLQTRLSASDPIRKHAETTVHFVGGSVDQREMVIGIFADIMHPTILYAEQYASDGKERCRAKDRNGECEYPGN